MGKGLSSLLSDSHLVVSNKVASFQGVKTVSIDSISVNPNQPRKTFEETALNELAASIRVHGVIQPITIREKADGKYELISGERRWRASQIAGLDSIPAFMRNVDDEKSLELALIENLQREDLNPIEIALAYQRMMDECKLKQEELGDRVGKKRATVANFLRLLQLPEDIQSGLITQQLTMGQAKPLISLEDKDFQLALYEQIITQGLSSRKVEQLAKQRPINEEDPLESHKEEMRMVTLGLNKKTILPVKIQVKGKDKGFVTIPIANEESMAELLELIG
ncbi:chromosome segregation DNA-binding protein [Spirosomataceae bacterium TFI 002]|nr:chromosome segregation DNA-binding protein [Spirosomataceae bacterium TFI 002]